VDPFSIEAVRAAYDTVAHDYQRTYGDDLARLPVDRSMLDAAASTVGEAGAVLDLGCGTGSAGSYLVHRGLRVAGLDLSTVMLGTGPSSRELLRVQGDMRRLPFGAGTFELVVAFYSVQHVLRSEVPEVLAEIARVLSGGGRLLLATHLGRGEYLSSEFLGHSVATVGGTFHSPVEIDGWIAGAGLTTEVKEQRGPLEHEYPSQRLYVLARKPG
jgi:ubiquinone/menaquinone biosynthesis C-methylase UbiE